MKWTFGLLLALSWAIPAFPDEIVLKDGKHIGWKSIVDQGDEYAVETVDGSKIKVRKADIDRMIVSAPTPGVPLLTGASFTLEKKKTQIVDLLAKADPKGDGVTGEWKRQGTAVVGSTGIAHAKIPLPFAPLPEEYDLTLVVERIQKVNALYVGIVSPEGTMGTVQFDAIEGAMCGLQLIDGKTFHDGEGNGTRIAGPVFKNNAPRTLKLMVRRDGFIGQIDGKDFLLWRAEWKKLSNHPALSIPQKNTLYVGIYDSSWKVHSVTLSFLKP